MTRTRRSILRTVSAATATAVGAGSVAAAGSTERSDSADGADASNPIRYSRIDTTNQNCGSDDSTTDVNQWGRFVRFSGTTPAPNPCHEAVIESTTLVGETLVVTVGTESDDSEMCVNCVAAIEYDGIILLSRSADVEDVEVRHSNDRDSVHVDVVEEFALDTGHTGCQDGESADESTTQRISVDGEVVEFSDEIASPDPCDLVVTESIERNGATLEVTITAESPSEAACFVCAGPLGYEGRIELADPSAIDEVVVRGRSRWN